MTIFKKFGENKAKKGIKLETFIDLFAGIGGFRIALEDLGMKCVFTSEWDKHAQITYKENFGEIPFGDITKIKESEIPRHDVLCAGFPCQAFSISGKQRGFEDARGTLFFDIARIAKKHKPKVMILENVKNFARHDKGRTIHAVLRILDELGYRTYYKVLNSSHYGSPTSRERIFFVCFRKYLGELSFHFPEPTFKKVYLKDVLENNANASKYIIERNDMKLIKPIVQQNALRPLQIGVFNNGGQGERIYSPNGHAVSLTAYGGGVASKTGAYLIDGKPRRLTPKECARVMGFPDWFKIPVSDTQAYKQFGNSIVVPLARTIAKNILDSLS
ncbi:MAG: DNA cytosine methyltransferase [Candidatus Aenigmarchaeota archaeon]|nr:DNA cytosine methyltransferase [Candidatus Aenigmarchaeota archaeon]